MKKIILALLAIGLILTAADWSFAVADDGLVLQYGFEDWTGDANTTPGYIMSSGYLDYWNTHTASTEVIYNPARSYSGSHYLHRQFNTTEEDPLLGEIATSINDHGNIGYGGTYPLGSGNKIQLSTAIVSNTISVRFRFRTTDEWKNQTSVTGYCKFFRLYGYGGGDDNASAFVHVIRGNNTNTRFLLYDSGTITYGPIHYAGADLQDGNWHCLGVQVTRNKDDNSEGNVTVKAWFDNWDMTGDPLGERTVTCTEFGSRFGHFAIAQNWSGTYPSSLMGLDVDDIEVWDGLPQGKPGDVNNNGAVNVKDMIFIATRFGTRQGDAAWDPRADLNANGVIDVTDLVTCARHFGE